MYEIIFSIFENKHIIRSCDILSTVKPLFIGTLEECNSKLSNFKGDSNDD